MESGDGATGDRHEQHRPDGSRPFPLRRHQRSERGSLHRGMRDKDSQDADADGENQDEGGQVIAGLQQILDRQACRHEAVGHQKEDPGLLGVHPEQAGKLDRHLVAP